MKISLKLILATIFIFGFFVTSIKESKAIKIVYPESASGSFQLSDGKWIRFNIHTKVRGYYPPNAEDIRGEINYEHNNKKGNSWLKVKPDYMFMNDWGNYKELYTQGPCIGSSTDLKSICEIYGVIGFSFYDYGSPGYKAVEGDAVRISPWFGGYLWEPIVKGNIQIK